MSESTTMKYAFWILLTTLASIATGSAQQPDEVTRGLETLEQKLQSGSDWQSWREFIMPDKADLKWQSIPWLATFKDGIEKAGEEDKPVLLWTMNGHPLGCT